MPDFHGKIPRFEAEVVMGGAWKRSPPPQSNRWLILSKSLINWPNW
jgi:hypothetical protein